MNSEYWRDPQGTDEPSPPTLLGHEDHFVTWRIQGFYSLTDPDDPENGSRYCDPYCVTCDKRIKET